VDVVRVWRDFFNRWPEGLPRQGVVVTSFGEQIVFVEFMVSESMLLVERRAPDTVGGRKVLLPFANIDAIKIIDPVSSRIFGAAGFQGSVSGKS
jgi:hypothetical protein